MQDLQEQVAQIQQQEVQAQMAPQGAGAADDIVSQLARLGELHQQGILSADEFEKAKARLIGG